MKHQEIVDRLFFWIKNHRLAILGGIAGLFGGLFTCTFGLLLGILLEPLVHQYVKERAIKTYLVEANPHFTGESKAGITAFCGLAFISVIPDQTQEIDFAMDHIVQSALQLFHCPLQDGATLEQVCRLAKENKKNINVDLLAESLKARTKNHIAPEQIVAVLRELVNLYGNNDFDKLNSIAQILCPEIELGGHHSPWDILGLKPDSSIQQIKKAFRKLALQFHPDRLSALSEERKRSAQERFIQIRRAYRQALAEKQEQKRDNCS